MISFPVGPRDMAAVQLQREGEDLNRGASALWQQFKDEYRRNADLDPRADARIAREGRCRDSLGEMMRTITVRASGANSRTLPLLRAIPVCIGRIR